MKTLNMKVIYIAAGERPVIRDLVYEQHEGEPFYDPSYEPLREMLGCEMVERVMLVPGVALWCDEEGRLVDKPEVICNVDAPYYVGDIVGKACVVALEHRDAGLFAPAFYEGIPDEQRMRMAGAALYTVARNLITPPEPGQVAAEPRIEVTGFDMKDDE